MTKASNNIGKFPNIIEQQINQWKITTSKHDHKKMKPPVITLSRDYGTYGAHLGELLAQELNFSFWHQDLVHRIAEETGLQEGLVKSLDEHTHTMIEDLLSGFISGTS